MSLLVKFFPRFQPLGTLLLKLEIVELFRKFQIFFLENHGFSFITYE